MTTVAVAVKGGGGSLGGNGSRRAVRWAVENLMPNATRFVLVHVVPTITSIPTPSGDTIPIEQLDANVVEMYIKDTKLGFQEIFLPFKKLCKRRKTETLVLEGDNLASALLKYVTDSGVSSLVLGSCSSSFITRKQKDSTLPSAVLKNAPEACNVYIVTKHRLLTTSAAPLSTGENNASQWCFNWGERNSLHIYKSNSGHYLSLVDCGATDTASSVSELSRSNSHRSNHSGSLEERNHQNSGNIEIEEVNECPSVSSTETKQSDMQAEVDQQCLELNGCHSSSSEDCEDNDTVSYVSDVSSLNSIAIAQERYPNNSGSLRERNHRNSGTSMLEVESVNECHSVASTQTKKSDVQAEEEQLRIELMNTVGMYNRAFEDLVQAQNEVHFLSSKCLEEERQVNTALQREEVYKKILAEVKRKHLEAVKEIEIARNLLAKETYERQIAESNALKESVEKKKTIDALLSNDRRYRRYTRDEIEIATDTFSETKMIGEGSYGKVYRCDLDKTLVAVKVLRSDALEKEKEFLTEIEVLSQLHHPNIVLLLGACPEIGCLVFEYMENGSLEDFVSCQSSRHPLPWFVRFRIAFEVACGLAFLHNTKPDPTIHRDLKPGNIFLDRNYVSKIGDVGLAKLVSNVAPDDVTEYRDSVICGSLHYMDPEYQRTGTVRPKSDLYAFGIIVLQLLVAQPPNGLLLKFKNAISNGSLYDILDKSIPDWPLAETEEMAQMALKCSELRCRDRPDLETEVLPLLKKLADMEDGTLRLKRNSIQPPNHHFCPILQEVMEDPYIAADGFTYEHKAIKAWLERYGLSPVTKLRLQHKVLIQNHTLRSAIQDWRSRTTSSSG
ncbi:U-box domain-containing protein 34-like [Rhododendron vialii]|uniref:U-box domain-containing protein 34-like n=1 Tax=Rhododendron vialii TaxID=182163 RepID=UPI00265EEACE|nr:U-box domain-containing protein 34-like [Rhododendron vialii]